MGYSSGSCPRPGCLQPARPGPNPQAFVFCAEGRSERPGEHRAAGNRLGGNCAGKAAEAINKAINKTKLEGKRTNPSEPRHLPWCSHSNGSSHLEARHKEGATATISASAGISD